MKPIIFSLFDEDQDLTNKLQSELKAEKGGLILHTFPDQETLIKIKNDLDQRSVIIIGSLNQPNVKLIPLLFFAKTAKDLGAKKVSLVAPYLAYMRQDKQFSAGEGISSHYFAELLSGYFDAVFTIDPHLHRYKSLSEIYSVPAEAISSAPAITKWIAAHVKNPFIIGPDMESEQWVSEIANQVKAPFVILTKIRSGDEAVKVSLPPIEFNSIQTPILVDDIISSAETMIAGVKTAQSFFSNKVICIGVHAVFAGNAYQNLLDTGAEVVTTNTIKHISNQIDVSELIASELD